MKPNVHKSSPDARAKRSPAAPPAYRPQPVPRALQTKQSRAAQLTGQLQNAPASGPHATSNRQLPVCLRGPSARAAVQPLTSRARAVQLADAGRPSDEQRRQARLQKFEKEHKQAEQEKSAEREKIDSLKSEVRSFRRAVEDGRIRFEERGSALKHGYDRPINVFKAAFEDAGYKDLEARKVGSALEITVRFKEGETVTGTWEGNKFTVFHCGEIQGGIGYGIHLG